MPTIVPESEPGDNSPRRRPGQSAWDVITATIVRDAGARPCVARAAARDAIFDLYTAGFLIIATDD